MAPTSSGHAQPGIVPAPPGGWARSSAIANPGRMALDDIRHEKRGRSPEQEAQLALAIMGGQPAIMSGSRRPSPMLALEDIAEEDDPNPQPPFAIVRRRMRGKSPAPAERANDPIDTEHWGKQLKDPNQLSHKDREKLAELRHREQKGERLSRADSEIVAIYKGKSFDRKNRFFFYRMIYSHGNSHSER